MANAIQMSIIYQQINRKELPKQKYAIFKLSDGKRLKTADGKMFKVR